MTRQEFDEYIKIMRTYRDKFVAHLDEEPVMHIPALRPAQKSVHELYAHIFRNESGYFPEIIVTAAACYSGYFRLGRKEIGNRGAT